MPIRCLFVFRRDRKKQLQEWLAGEGTSEFLFGLPYLDKLGIEASFVEGDDASWHWKRIVTRPFEKVFDRWIGIGFGLHITWRHWHKIKQADIVVSTVDTCGLPLAMLKYLGILQVPVIYISQGLTHRIRIASRESLLAGSISRAYIRFLNSVERVLLLSDGAVEPFVDTFNVPSERVFFLPFGTDDEFWTPGPESVKRDYILSVGSDLARDYPTLLRAAIGQELYIVTRLALPQQLLSPTVHVESEFTQVELRALYRAAKFVVIPLDDVDQPSGQSATLQAMACGKAVILTRTQGLWEPDRMRHMETCYLVQPHDVDDLRRGILYLQEYPEEAVRISENARSLVEERYNTRRLAGALGRHIYEVVDSQGPI